MFLNIFIPIIIFVSFITIVITWGIVKDKRIIKWYLLLKSPLNTNLDKTIKNVFEKNKFNKLIEKWTNYNIAVTSLWLQSSILLIGFLFSFSSFLVVEIQTWNYLILIAIIFFIAEIIIAKKYFQEKISRIFKISEEDLSFTKKIVFESVIIFIVNIPFWIVFLYIILNNPEMNFNTFFSIYLILTLGMYEYTKKVLGFFSPIPANGIYSTDELIKGLLSAPEVKPSLLEEIIDAG